MKKRVFIALVVVLALAVTASLVWANPGLVGYWAFDEGMGTTAVDASGNGNNGTITGATYTGGGANAAPVPGNVDALNFAAIDDLVRVPNDSVLCPPNITVSAWVRNVGTPTDYDYILAKTLDGGKGSYAFYTRYSGGLWFYVSDAGDYYPSVDAGPGIWDGDWHHIAGTYDGSDVRLFVDGSEIGTAQPGPLAIAYGTSYFNGDLSIGNYDSAGSRFEWRGDIDEVRIYDEALPPDQIATLAERWTEVEIDIKPGSDPNCFNLNGHGVIPVAILSSADFDATSVDPETVMLGGMAIRYRGKGYLAHAEDVNSDGLLDLVVQIEDSDGSLTEGDTTATLEARTYGGLPIWGSDSICMVP